MRTYNLLAVVAVVAVAFALFNLVITMNKVGDVNSITGYAELADTGSANLSIESNLIIVFTTDELNWGAGHVDTPAFDFAVFDTDAGNVTNGINWVAQSSGLLLENQGNVDADLYFKSSLNAHDFICAGQPAGECTLATAGTADAEFQWWFNENTEGACPTQVNGNGDWTGYQDVCVDGDAGCDDSPLSAGEGISICSDFVGGSLDQIEIDLRLVIPSDAGTGAKAAVITASAYAV